MRDRSIYCSGCGRRHIGRRWRGVCRSRCADRDLLGIVENYAERVPGSAVDAANTVTEIYAIVAAGTFYGTVAGGEDDCLALAGRDYFSFGLCARLLLDQEEFAAFPISAWLAEQKNHLQRERNFAVEILMQAIVAAGFVMKHQRRRFGLPCLVAQFQEGGVIGGKRRLLIAECLCPFVRDFG